MWSWFIDLRLLHTLDKHPSVCRQAGTFSQCSSLSFNIMQFSGYKSNKTHTRATATQRVTAGGNYHPITTTLCSVWVVLLQLSAFYSTEANPTTATRLPFSISCHAFNPSALFSVSVYVEDGWSHGGHCWISELQVMRAFIVFVSLFLASQTVSQTPPSAAASRQSCNRPQMFHKCPDSIWDIKWL